MVGDSISTGWRGRRPNPFSLIFLFLFIAVACGGGMSAPGTTPAPETSAPTTSEARALGKGRFRIQNGHYCVDSAPFIVKGIGYEPGTRPGQYPWDRVYEPDIIERDLLRIKEAGFNTLRNWSGYTGEELRHAEKHGLWVIQGIWIDPAGDFGDSRFVQAALETVDRAVSVGRNHENILMYVVMNEPTAATILKAGEEATFALFRRVRDRIHELDPGVPVSFANTGIGDFLDASVWDAVAFNLYMYNPVTVSRVLGYRGYIEWLRRARASDKPLVVTEYGLSVSPKGEGNFGYGGNTPAQQIAGDLWMHRGLIEGGADGGAVFTYADGWWKNADNQGDALTHDPEAEEWFGFFSFSSLKDKVGRPRPVYEAYRAANRAIWTEPVSWRLYGETVPVEVFVTDDVTGGRIVLSSGPPVPLSREGSWLRGSIPAERIRGVDMVRLEITGPRRRPPNQTRTIIADWAAAPAEKRPVVFTLREAPVPAPAGEKFRVVIEASSAENGVIANRTFTVGFHTHEGWDAGRIVEVISDETGRIVLEAPSLGNPGALTLSIGTGYAHLDDGPVWGEVFVLKTY